LPRDVTGIDRKVFLRALSWLWDRGNRRRFDGDMTEWSLWHSWLNSGHQTLDADKRDEEKINPRHSEIRPQCNRSGQVHRDEKML